MKHLEIEIKTNRNFKLLKSVEIYKLENICKQIKS